MTQGNNIFESANLALAAYANLISPDLTSSNRKSLEDAGMSEKQSELFAARWPEIVEQYNDPDTDVSLTVFRSGNDVATIGLGALLGSVQKTSNVGGRL